MKKSPDYNKELEKIIKEKRQKRDQWNEHHTALIEAVKGSFSDFGVSAIQLGDNIINVKEVSNVFSHKDEAHYVDLLNKGVPLFILNFNSDAHSYYDKEKVEFSDRKLSELIDEELVRSLAPTSKIYAPGEEHPWQDNISTDSFFIFITDKNELEALWKKLTLWAKTKWHDDIMSKSKYFHKSEHVFNISLRYDMKPDISWRLAQLKSKQQKVEKLENMGTWDSLAQQELKKIVGSLINIEDHPIINEDVAKLLEKVKPLLIDSMSGKEVLKSAKKELDDAYDNIRDTWKSKSISWDDWTPNLPI